MKEAIRKTNLLIRFHPVLWGGWILLVLFASIQGFLLMISVPLTAFLGLIVYVNSTGNEIEYMVPLEDEEIRDVWYGGVKRICRFGAMGGACGIGLQIAYLMSALYAPGCLFVRVMQWIEERFIVISEIGYGIGADIYGTGNVQFLLGRFDVQTVCWKMLCWIAMNACCFAIGMLLLYHFGIVAVSERISLETETDSRQSTVRRVTLRIAKVAYLSAIIWTLVFRSVSTEDIRYSYILGILLLVLLALFMVVMGIKSTIRDRFIPEYRPERKDG